MVVIAQVWAPGSPRPALIAVKVRTLETGTGVAWLTYVSSPSWPRSFSPQQYAAPLVLIAHV